MKKFPKIIIILGVACLFLWDSAASAFEFLYDKDGKKYYKTDAGQIISRAIPKGTKGLVLIHQERDGRKKYYQAFDGKIIVEEQVGGMNPGVANRKVADEGTVVGVTLGGNLSNAPDYDWWYGCSPTSAGMMMGYYDINGYGGESYDNLVPGGTAELNTFPTGTYLVNSVIASDEHIADYWVGYGQSGNDPDPGGHLDNCLADFMETSKDSANNSDGASRFYYFTNGSPFYPSDVETYGLQSSSGMYGIGEWVTNVGHSYDTLYNQYHYDSTNYPNGMTFAQYKAEIDAGRPMLLNIEGHTMFAYGYTDPDTVYVHDTWSSGSHTMTWGGSYSGYPHTFMTGLTLSGGNAFECPPGSLDEGETCGADTNGGCNMGTPAFTSVNLGDTYCGLAWADGDTRDTDWYELVLTSPKSVTLTSSGNFPFVVGFVPTDPPGTGDCADVIGSLDPYETGSPFEEVSVQSDLPAGTHLLFVAPSGFNDYPCPGPWKYYLTIEGQGAVAAGMFLLLLGN